VAEKKSGYKKEGGGNFQLETANSDIMLTENLPFRNFLTHFKFATPPSEAFH
jgi:hypothetical protein